MDKGKEKMSEYEDDPFNNNESTYSLDNEFGAFDVPLMRIPDLEKAIAMANEKLCHSTREKNLIS